MALRTRLRSSHRFYPLPTRQENHVIARGIGQRKIFDDDVDSNRVLERLGMILLGKPSLIAS